jgi:hypothetical protein
MSFDIYLDLPACSHCGRSEQTVFDVNITHNVNKIVDTCLREAGATVAKEGNSSYSDWSWRRLHRWRAGDAVKVLARAEEIMGDPTREQEFKALEPSNKWGTLAVTQHVLSELLAACRRYPNATIRTSG